MTPFKLYFLLGIFVEIFPIIPILAGFRKWKQFSTGIWYFGGFLISDLLLNLVSDYYYYLHINNLFLYYLYSLSQNIFVLTMFLYFSKRRLIRFWILLFFFLNLLILFIDLFFVSGIGYNYVSAVWIDIVLSVTALSYFSIKVRDFRDRAQLFSEINLPISLVLGVQFFVKAVVVFLEKQLLMTQNNVFYWLQLKCIYYFLTLFFLILYTYCFNNYKTDEV